MRPGLIPHNHFVHTHSYYINENQILFFYIWLRRAFGGWWCCYASTRCVCVCVYGWWLCFVPDCPHRCLAQTPFMCVLSVSNWNHISDEFFIFLFFYPPCSWTGSKSMTIFFLSFYAMNTINCMFTITSTVCLRFFTIKLMIFFNLLQISKIKFRAERSNYWPQVNVAYWTNRRQHNGRTVSLSQIALLKRTDRRAGFGRGMMTVKNHPLIVYHFVRCRHNLPCFIGSTPHIIPSPPIRNALCV